MATLTPLPDIVDVVAQWLRTDDTLAKAVAGIGDHLPAAETRAWVAVSAAGGTTLHRGWARERRIAVNVWAGSSEKTGRARARAIAELAANVLETLTDQTFAGAVFGAVDIVSDFVELPDMTFIPQRPRCVFTARLITHPDPTA